MSENPLLAGYQQPRFDLIKTSHVVPSVESMLMKLEEKLQQIENISDPNWEASIWPLDEMRRTIQKTWGTVTHLLNVQNSEELREAYEKAQPDIIKFVLKLQQSEALYNNYKKMQKGPDWKNFDEAQKRIIDTAIRDAELSGIALKGEAKTRYNAISQELSRLSTKFSNNVLDATKAYSLLIEEEKDVVGMPANVKALAAQSYNQVKKKDAKEATAEKGPWRFTLDYPSYMPFMQNCRNRSLREQIYRSYVTRASSGTFDNTENLKKILRLRKEQAKLLGYKTHADVSITKKMADSVEAVDGLLEKLRKASWDKGLEEIEELEKFAATHGFKEKMTPWDKDFWSERLREQKFHYTDEELRPYFPLPQVLDGLFSLVHRLFDVRVEAAPGEVTTWDPAITYYKLFRSDGTHFASFYLDPYTRPENKRGGAWMDECVSRSRIGDSLEIPVAYIVCNSSPPVNGKPSTLGFRDVETLFHEFGHGLQHMLTTVDYAAVAGINGIEWDAIEIASQFMENWCYHKPTLKGLTSHIDTGEEIPDALFDKIVAAKTFQAATDMLRQLRFGMTDMELHHRFDPDSGEDIFKVAKRIADKTSIIPILDGDRLLCSFSHIFAGGYSAGYFSYKWAEVLSADAFGAFEEIGLSQEETIRETGNRYRDTILALGGGRHPMKVFVDFRGREPTIDALLRHNGLA